MTDRGERRERRWSPPETSAPQHAPRAGNSRLLPTEENRESKRFPGFLWQGQKDLNIHCVHDGSPTVAAQQYLTCRLGQ